MRGIKITFRAVSIAFTALLALLLACNLYFIAARALTGEHPTLFGYSTAVVVSGSMSGTIEVDDMVIIHRRDSYSCGDIITYKDNGSLVTHRIVEISEDGFYITKGDANNAVDSEPVSDDDVVGCVVFTIPKIGRLISALRTPFGMCCMVLVGIIFIEIPSLAEKLRAKKEVSYHGKHTKK